MSVIETMIDIPAEHERKCLRAVRCIFKENRTDASCDHDYARDGEIKLIGPEKIRQAKAYLIT